MHPGDFLTRFSFACLAALPAAAAAENTFGIDEYHALTHVSGIAASPDGAYVAYTASVADLEADAYAESVWLQPADGGTALRMSAPGSATSSPKWSPDGRYLAVLSDRKDETSQVWLYDRRGGDAQPPESNAAYVCSFLGVLLALVTGWLGGELVNQLGIGVHDGANVDAPSSLRTARARVRAS